MESGRAGIGVASDSPLLTVDPAAAYDDQILRLVADAALQPQTSEPAVQLPEQKMGEYGPGVDMIELADRTTMESIAVDRR